MAKKQTVPAKCCGNCANGWGRRNGEVVCAKGYTSLQNSEYPEGHKWRRVGIEDICPDACEFEAREEEAG